MKNKICFKLVIVLIILVSSSLLTLASSDIWYYQPSPQGFVGVSRPTITWVFDSLGGNEITDVEITIDGKTYKGYYNKTTKKISYTPSSPLDVGEHNVIITVTINNKQKIRNSFKFTIDDNPLNEINNGDTIEEVRKTINKYRKIIGINEVKFNNSLDIAAKAHSKYLLENKKTGHYEYNKNSPLYTGEEPIDRAKYFNYTSPIVAENIHFTKSHQQAVNDWMNSVYHRLPLINPKFTEIGYGFSFEDDKYVNVLDLGTSNFMELEEQIITYPVDGQKHIPVSWINNEEPNPLKMFTNAKKTTGYPITLSVLGDGIIGIKINKISVTLNGNEAESYVLVPELENKTVNESKNLKTDENLKTDIVIIPKRELEKNKTYNVYVSGSIIYLDNKEKDFIREWSFTTGSGDFRFDYMENKKMLNIYVNQDELYFKNKPYIKNGITNIPIREYCEFIGAEVIWRQENRGITIKLGEKEIILHINDNKAIINGKEKKFDSEILLIDGIAYGPLRLISESLGYKILWDGEYKDIFITTD